MGPIGIINPGRTSAHREILAAGTTRSHETRREVGGVRHDIPEHPCMLVGPTRGPRIPRRPPFNGPDCASPPTTAASQSPPDGAARRAPTRMAGPPVEPGWRHLAAAACRPRAAAWPATRASWLPASRRPPPDTGPACHRHAPEEIGCAGKWEH